MNVISDSDFSPGNDSAEYAPLPPDSERRWMMKYLPLVRRIVNQLSLQATQVVGREDMEQIGLVGLLEALRRYGEPDVGFGRFATLRIRGAILDELRRLDWRPRRLRQRAHGLRDAIRGLVRQLGREPAEAEILRHTGLSSQEYLNHLQAESSEVIASLDSLILDGLGQFEHAVTSVEEQVLQERILAQALAHLDERERLILTLYYHHELNLKEIAQVLELTEARICQLMKQAITKACSFLTARA